LDRSKFGANLNTFEINLIRLENRIGRTVLPTLPVNATLTASPRCPVPPLAAEDRAPIASRPYLSAAAPTPRRRAAPRCARPPLSLSLSPAPPPCGVHPSRAPSPPFPLKQSRRPPAEKIFSPRAPFVSSLHARASCIHHHHPGILLTGFPPPEPLLHAGLRLHVTAVCPPSGERPSSCPIPQLTTATSPPGSPLSCRTSPRSSMTVGATPP
jgi:hypothetical protein